MNPMICSALVLGQAYTDTNWYDFKKTDQDSHFKVKWEVLAKKSKSELEHIVSMKQGLLDHGKGTDDDLFSWSSALMLRTRGDFDYYLKTKKWFDENAGYKKLCAIKSPTYTFARARFVLTSAFVFRYHPLVKIGERLMKVDPNDKDVSSALFSLYQPQAWPEDRAKGIQLMGTLEKVGLPPLTIAAKSMDFWWFCWMKSKSKDDADKAASCGRRAYALSNSDAQRKIFKRILNQMGKSI